MRILHHHPEYQSPDVRYQTLLELHRQCVCAIRTGSRPNRKTDGQATALVRGR